MDTNTEWKLEAAPPDPALVKLQQETIAQLMSAWGAPMERACELVFNLGYSPSEFLIEDHPPQHHRVLSVRGEKVFEQRARWEGWERKTMDWLSVCGRVNHDPGDEDGAR